MRVEYLIRMVLIAASTANTGNFLVVDLALTAIELHIERVRTVTPANRIPTVMLTNFPLLSCAESTSLLHGNQETNRLVFLIEMSRSVDARHDRGY